MTDDYEQTDDDRVLISQIKALRDQRRDLAALKTEAESDLVAFVRMMWRAVEPEAQFVHGWPVDAMADALMAVSDGEIRRLLINIFPGAMKSLMLNVFFPAWEWGPRGMPHLRYISTSYSSGLTERDNARLLRVVSDPVYRRCWPGVTITKEGVGYVENAATGWKLATSVGGKMTGFRADRILIDDANNPANVDSSDVREQTNLWLREVMPDRLNNLDKGAIISIQQRTHEEDATGTLAQYGTGYSWLCIPMEFDPMRSSSVVLRRNEAGEPEDVWSDPRGLDDEGDELDGLYTDAKGQLQLRHGSPMAHAEGQLAWPDRFSPTAIEEQKRIKGPYGWAGQYQQSPGARGGGIIRRDWWQTWPTELFPDFGTIVASLDTALEQNTTSDYNAFIAMGAFPNDAGAPQLMLRAGWKQRMPLADLVKRVADDCYRIKADYLLIEHKTRGRDVFDEIRRLYASAPWKTVLIVPMGDKVSRLNAVSHLFSGDKRIDATSGIEVYENGMIWAPDTDWAEEVITEVANFPRGAHDDMTDALSQALAWIRRNGVVLRKVEHDNAESDARRYKRRPGVPYAIGKGI